MAYIFSIIFISKLVSVKMACLLVIQNEIQALWFVTSEPPKYLWFIFFNENQHIFHISPPTYLTHIFFMYFILYIGFSFSWNYFLEWDYYGYLKFLREYLQLTGELKSYQNLEKFTSKIFFDLGTWPIYSTCFKVCTFFSYLSVRGMSLKLFLKWEKEAKPQQD